MSNGFARLTSLLVVLCLVTTIFAPLTVFAETSDPLNVKDFGAVGDGVTDDLAAIQAAIDAASAGSGGGVVTFPAGTYLVKEFILLKSDITLLLDDDATILNGINYSTGPSIVFMTGPFVRGGDKIYWEDTENITIIGGTIDMNGELNADGSAAKNLPNIGSSGAFALGYCDNVLIEGVTFLDSYKGHVIQICACDGVTIKDCTFKGHSLPNTLTESQKTNLELVQIEPSSTKGFPYASNETGEASQNITIQGCYFGASEKCGEPVVGVGTHSQLNYGEKCNHIDILKNEFDNVMYAGVRFCGYEDVTIRGNTFTKKTEAESVNYRSGGCFLINAYCYNNTTDELDLNRRITIDNNVFNVSDPVTRAIRVTKDQDTYLGTVTDITVTNNTITNTSTGSNQMAIQTMRISDGLTVTGNTIQGGYRGIETQYCTGNIKINSNALSGLDDQYVRLISCGDSQTLYFYTHESGTFNVSTANGSYTITAVPNIGYTFVGYYSQNALTTLVSTSSTLVYPIAQSTNVYRHASFAACSHTYTTAVIAPTCTGQGYTSYTCATCGYSYATAYTAARGHSFTNYSSNHDATCTQDGTKTAVCDHGCGTTNTITVESSATGHCYGGWMTTKTATCAAAGSKSRTCVTCGDVQTQSIAATGHAYDVVVREATCKEYATFQFTCGDCGDQYTRSADEMTSEWIDAIPGGMDASLFTRKTQYRWSDLETVTSDSAAMEGYTLKSSVWEQSGTDTVYYVPSWPSGFSTGCSLYTAYDKTGSKLTASTTSTDKTTVDSDGVVGYLYYHWCYTDSYYSQASGSGSYTTFHAYYSPTSPQNFTCDTSDYSYKTSDACCANSEWFFVTEVYAQKGTSYRKLFSYEGWTDPTDWSDPAVTASATRKVETRDVYQLEEATFGEHNYVDGACSVCGDGCDHSWSDGMCSICGTACVHIYAHGVCTVCGINKPVKDLYLFGYINGADYACEGDWEDLGQYQFVDGKLTAFFTQDSYVAVKSGDNQDWYMLSAYYGENVTAGTLFNTSTGAGEKLFVPGGKDITFTLKDNGDDTYTLSYVATACTHPGHDTDGNCTKCGATVGHAYTSSTVAATCATAGKTTYSCATCGHSYSETIAATGHSYSGGSCTVCGGADPDYSVVVQPSLSLNYGTVSFESEIQYNIYFDASNLDSVVEMGMITFDSQLTDGTIDDAVKVYPNYSTDGSVYMIATEGIAAKNMADQMWFKIYAKLSDGSYVYTTVNYYSAVRYANSILGRASSSSYSKALVVAMLNYGAEAQLYFGHNTDDLANAGLTEEQKALDLAYDETMVDAVVAPTAAKSANFVYTASAFTNRYPSVSFDGAFSINFYFVASQAPDDGMTFYYWDIETYDSVDVLTKDNATGTMDMTLAGTNSYYGVVDGIAAKEMDETVFVAGVYEVDGVEYTTGIIAYSLGRYCETIAAKDTFDQQAFAQATAVYGYYAKQYFANL